jgi:hypothetical protein
MCQQWLSVGGLVLDVIGFLLIAREWYHVFLHSVLMRQVRVEEDYNRTRAAERGEAYDDPTEADASMWRNTQRENLRDNQHRAQLFYIGTTLVVLGFFLQLLGSWPYGILSFRSC